MSRSRPLVLGLLLVVLAWPGGRALSGEEGAPAGGRVDKTTNRLATERSPYLRQHATNPVDWYPWGDEAFARARRENKPVLLSVGYAACHWCHVMEHESFEDEATARLLNEAFVCVKVDREERPDVDALYMQAVHVMAGRGGWPMTVLLTPEGDPFWAGTYLPRESVQSLARKASALWKEDASRLRTQAAQISEHVRDISDGRDLPPFEGGDPELLRVLEGALVAQFDERFGGYGTEPKFPPHAELLTVLDRWEEKELGLLRDQVRRTLEAMDEGGVHDQVGGGFHRYSTDRRWLVPHFEKMLYDNALLAQAYAGLYARTKEPRFAAVARDILAWVRRDMAQPGGGYASSLDADTEGEEGLTYTWTLDEVAKALGDAEDAALVGEVFGLSAKGNFHDEATGRLTGRNIPHLPRPLAEVAAERGEDVKVLAGRLAGLRARLLAARGTRAQPGLDDKVIVAWNGLMLSAFARCGAYLPDPSALEDARALASFLLTSCRREDGTLLRFPRGSGPEIPGYAEDHVHVIEGLLDLAEATGEASWAEAAREIADDVLAHFEDTQEGGFWTNATDRHETLFARRKATFDDPIPSENGTAARLLLRLAQRTGEARYRKAADRTLAAWRPLMANARAARGVVALYRALALRVAEDAAAGRTTARGDVSVESSPLLADLFVQRVEAKPGSRVPFALRVEMEPGWHVNADRAASPDLVPTRLDIADGPVRLADLHYPDAEVGQAGSGEERAPRARMTFEGIFWLRGVLVVSDDAPQGPRRVLLRLRVQPCSLTACEAERTLELDLPFRVGDEDGWERHGALFGD